MRDQLFHHPGFSCVPSSNEDPKKKCILERKTIDPQLEKKNFIHTKKILAEIWLGMIIEGQQILAEYINEVAEE